MTGHVTEEESGATSAQKQQDAKVEEQQDETEDRLGIGGGGQVDTVRQTRSWK